MPLPIAVYIMTGSVGRHVCPSRFMAATARRTSHAARVRAYARFFCCCHIDTDAAAPHLMHHRGSSGLSGTVAFGVAGGRSGGCSMPKEVPEFLYAISPRVASAGN